AVLAIAQMGVHLVFFLHITTGPDSTNNVLALAFGVLIVFLVLAESLVIMANLNENMMPHTEIMNLQMQHCSSGFTSTPHARRNDDEDGLVFHDDRILSCLDLRRASTRGL